MARAKPPIDLTPCVIAFKKMMGSEIQSLEITDQNLKVHHSRGKRGSNFSLSSALALADVSSVVEVSGLVTFPTPKHREKSQKEILSDALSDQGETPKPKPKPVVGLIQNITEVDPIIFKNKTIADIRSYPPTKSNPRLTFSLDLVDSSLIAQDVKNPPITKITVTAHLVKEKYRIL